MQEMSVEEYALKRHEGWPHLLLDVREANELAICKIAPHVWIPLGDLSMRLGELDPDENIIVLCHHGGRSARAVYLLSGRGFDKVWNLVGGIDAYAVRVEPTLPRY
ncbi:MAG: rhodanese-like domain-containing protein [Holosporales bacterium]